MADRSARAKGDFVCLLEHDSAVSKGSIARQLEPFLNNPKFRKLAMVSPLIEFDDTKPMALNGFGSRYPQQPQLARSGSVGGAIIRRTSIMKNKDLLKTNLTTTSHGVSVSLWEHGLRIMVDPTSVYYSPQKFKRGIVVNVSDSLLELWTRECIV